MRRGYRGRTRRVGPMWISGLYMGRGFRESNTWEMDMCVSSTVVLSGARRRAPNGRLSCCLTAVIWRARRWVMAASIWALVRGGERTGKMVEFKLRLGLGSDIVDVLIMKVAGSLGVLMERG